MSAPRARSIRPGDRLRTARLLGSALLALACASAGAQTREEFRCPVRQPAATLDQPLPRVAARLRDGRPLTIVTIGSSSTAGAGASSIQATYPARLGIELLQRYPGRVIKVINSGTNGEEVPAMLKRFERDLFAYQPDLVIWQIGTNSLLRRTDPRSFAAGVRSGIARIRSADTDVMLMDLQFVPRVEEMPARDAMLADIEALAREHGVALFRRHAVMRGWAQALGDDYARMVSPDRLHLNDFSYHCLAAELASAITASVGPAPSTASTPSTASAAAQPAAAGPR
ncbi:MAG: SGNH/GDSL hydrolase family protein [Burkholderiaceae bacterium]